MTLYEISERYQKLLDMSEEIPPEALRDTLESLDGEFADKIENYAAVIKQLDAEKSTLEDEVKRLQARVKSRNNRIRAMRNAMAESMSASGQRNISTPRFTVCLAPSAGELVYDPMAVVNWAEDNGHDDLLDYTVDVDKKRLREYMAEHDDAPAEIRVKESVRIR